LFLDGLVAGQYVVADLSAGTLRRGVEIDPRFADLDLDFVDGAVMAIAERLRSDPDLRLRALPWHAPAAAFCRLVVDEARCVVATG
jgi:hypothetical protein